MSTVDCPICNHPVYKTLINAHIDSGCAAHVSTDPKTPTAQPGEGRKGNGMHGFFKGSGSQSFNVDSPNSTEYNGAREYLASLPSAKKKVPETSQPTANGSKSLKRPFDEASSGPITKTPPHKRAKTNPLEKLAPLAERMRPKTLDDVCGQELVGPNGVLRSLIESNGLPSIILWGSAGTGKTTIARLIAKSSQARFIEINSTSSGVGECKKIFEEARNELSLTGRRTIIFCDEIHRFSKSQQDVFLGPVESGQVTLIGATTENPSFKVVNPLLSRCRTFTLSKLSEQDIAIILERALRLLNEENPSQNGISLAATHDPSTAAEDGPSNDPNNPNGPPSSSSTSHPLLNTSMLHYLSTFSDGDARTALNLLELAHSLTLKQPHITASELNRSLTHTLVYDRSGDQHYDTISAFHKSIRGSDPDASLYYLARMLTSGEDALYIARRMVVIASEDVGLADNTLLPLCIAAYTAAERVGLPEARINLAHAAVALALAGKSTRAYRGLENAMGALAEPGVAGLEVPVHLRNAPTRLMKEIGYGREYKYNPDYVDGRVRQEYLPEKLRGRRFLEDRDLGENVDPDLG